MIRLLFVTSGLAVGGAEISLLNLLQRFDRRRFDLHVASLTGKGEIGPRIEALGIPVTAFDFVHRPLRDFVALARLVRSLRPDVVQTWMYHADLLGSLAARLAGVRNVVWGIRNSNLAPGASARHTVTVAKLCARLSRWLPRSIVSCSHAAREIHRKIGYRCARFEVIGNGFDLTQFRPDPSARDAVRVELGLAAETPVALHVGRFHPQKNHAGLVRAAGLVHRIRPDVQFVLVGSGVDSANAELAHAMAASGAADAIHLLGLRHDTVRLMASADVLVLSSVFGEAFPRVLGESMACAVPCVATDVGDSRAIVGDAGTVVPAGDDAALARAVLEMLALEPAQRQRLGALARERAERDFDIAVVARQYEKTYIELTEGSLCAA